MKLLWYSVDSLAMNCPPILAVKKRGPLDESIFRGHIVVADGHGNIIQSFGNPHYITYFRSSAKPFQAMALLLTETYEYFGLELEHLAIACGSHNGQARHAKTVLEILSRAGLSEKDLLCGTHEPISAAAKAELDGKPLSQLNHNCSGKHSAMLAVCKKMGWDTKTYLEPTHPIQKLSLEIVAGICGLPVSDVVVATDGCGVQVFGVPLVNMAQGFARLSDPDSAPLDLQEPAKMVFKAMTKNPELVAGVDRVDTIAMKDNPDFAIKSGAEGVNCISANKKGLALKMESGEGHEPFYCVVTNCVRLLDGKIGELKMFDNQPLMSTNGVQSGQVVWRGPF